MGHPVYYYWFEKGTMENNYSKKLYYRASTKLYGEKFPKAEGDISAIFSELNIG